MTAAGLARRIVIEDIHHRSAFTGSGVSGPTQSEDLQAGRPAASAIRSH
jgi:hypothetical protein